MDSDFRFLRRRMHQNMKRQITTKPPTTPPTIPPMSSPLTGGESGCSGRPVTPVSVLVGIEDIEDMIEAVVEDGELVVGIRLEDVVKVGDSII